MAFISISLWVGFFSFLIAVHFKIANRGWFLYFPVFIINFFGAYIMLLHQTILSMFEVTLIDYLVVAFLLSIFYFFGLVIGGFLGFLASFFITLPDRPPKYKIKENIISFKLSSQSEEDNSILAHIIGNYICKDLHYFRFKIIDETTTVYKTKKFRPIHHIFASKNDKNISYFPYIKDGFKYVTNKELISYIKVIGTRIFGLEVKSDDSLIPKFIKYTELHKRLSTIKSIFKRERLNRNEWICVFVLCIFVLIMSLIFVFPIQRLEFSFNLSVINIIVTLFSTAVVITTTIISIIMYGKYSKLKKEKK